MFKKYFEEIFKTHQLLLKQTYVEGIKEDMW